jgi:hypothetical protein
MRPRCVSVRFGFAALEVEVGPRSERTLSGRRDGSSSARERNEERIVWALRCVRGAEEWWIVGGRGVRPGWAIFQVWSVFGEGMGVDVSKGGGRNELRSSALRVPP